MQQKTDAQASQHTDPQNTDASKKVYQAPALTDYGTVEQFTKSGLGSIGDGPTGCS